MHIRPNSKYSIKSTWRFAPRDQWSVTHRLLDILNVYPSDLNKEVPIHSKDEKIPYMSQLSANIWVLFYAAIPFLIHQAFGVYSGCNLSNAGVIGLYTTIYNVIIIHQMHIIRRLSHMYGFLDGGKERDGIPDVGVQKVLFALFKITVVRIAMATYCAYNPSQLPSQMDWKWLPLEIGIYSLVVDFWFYWYHRLMHENSYLWQYHRIHHLTKHPNSTLSAYADHTQEFFDMAGIPMIAYFTLKLFGLPMGVYEWWVCHQYVTFGEVLGHSGVRLHSTSASPFSWVLQSLSCELVTEDHDLHHRKGWRKSYNYGKQSRLWDRVFGTLLPREESDEDNVDYDNTAWFPLF